MINKNLIKLLWACKLQSGYAGHTWEVGTDFRDENQNKPFKPGLMPGGEELNDSWDGGLESLSGYYKDLRIGTYLDCYIYSRDGGLIDNVDIHFISEYEATVDGILVKIDPTAPPKPKIKRTLIRNEQKRSDRLWVRNTSQYPMLEVWPLIKCAYESVERSLTGGHKMPRVIVKLTNCCWSYRGRAHWTEYQLPECKASAPQYRYGMPQRYAPGVQQWVRILVRIGNPSKFPVKVRYPRFKGDMPEYDCATYREAIVMVAAHEMEHCLGASGRKGGEFRCELAAWDAIDYYRKHQDQVEGTISSAMIAQSEKQDQLSLLKEVNKRPEIILTKKLEKAQRALAKWQRKQKLAGTKTKFYLRTINRLTKKLAAMAQPEIRQAATTPSA